MDYSALAQQISGWLKDYLEQGGLCCFVVGVSGGIDSAVASSLAAQTGVKTYALNLPIHSKAEYTGLSDLHCRNLCERFANVEYLKRDLSSAYDAFMQIVEPDSAAGGQKSEGDETLASQKLAAANSKARLRMLTLYYLAGKHNGLVVGTGNKVEDFGVGFFTKYGDGGVDISPIADLTKTQVRALGGALEVAPEIIAAPPTDGLWEDARNDEQQLGASYEELEWAMQAQEPAVLAAPAANAMPVTEREREVLELYRGFHRKNLHKMQAIPVFRLPG